MNLSGNLTLAAPQCQLTSSYSKGQAAVAASLVAIVGVVLIALELCAGRSIAAAATGAFTAVPILLLSARSCRPAPAKATHQQHPTPTVEFLYAKGAPIGLDIDRLLATPSVRGLGQGVFGTVRLFEQEGTRYAVKQSACPEFCTELAHEFALGQALQSTSFVCHHGLATISNTMGEAATTFLVMEYVEGETLWDYFDRVVEVPIEQRTAFIQTASHALLSALDRGILPADLHGENLMVERESGSLRLIDFNNYGRVDQEKYTIGKLLDDYFALFLSLAGDSALSQRVFAAYDKHKGVISSIETQIVSHDNLPLLRAFIEEVRAMTTSLPSQPSAPQPLP